MSNESNLLNAEGLRDMPSPSGEELFFYLGEYDDNQQIFSRSTAVSLEKRKLEVKKKEAVTRGDWLEAAIYSKELKTPLDELNIYHDNYITKLIDMGDFSTSFNYVFFNMLEKTNANREVMASQILADKIFQITWKWMEVESLSKWKPKYLVLAFTYLRRRDFKSAAKNFQQFLDQLIVDRDDNDEKTRKVVCLQLGELYFQGRIHNGEKPDSITCAIMAFEYLKIDKDWLEKIILIFNESSWIENENIPRLNISLKNFYRFYDYYKKNGKLAMIDSLLGFSGCIKRSDLISLTSDERKELFEKIKDLSGASYHKINVIIMSLRKEKRLTFFGNSEQRKLTVLGIDANALPPFVKRDEFGIS